MLRGRPWVAVLRRSDTDFGMLLTDDYFSDLHTSDQMTSRVLQAYLFCSSLHYNLSGLLMSELRKQQ